MSELQVSLVFSVIIWVNVIRENYLTFFPSRCRRYPSFFLQTRPFQFVVTRVCLVLFGLLPTLFYLRILQIFEQGNEGLLALTDYYKVFLNYNVLKISLLYLFLSYKRPFFFVQKQENNLFPTEEKIYNLGQYHFLFCSAKRIGSGLKRNFVLDKFRQQQKEKNKTQWGPKNFLK